LNDYNAQFNQALFPPSRKVLGLWLKPFSHGHLALLESFQSPFVFVTGKPHLEDFLIAVVLCSRPVEEAARFQSEGFPLRWRLWMIFAAILLNNRHEEAMASFHADLINAARFRIEGLWVNSEIVKTAAAPGLGVVIRSLANYYHFSESKILNMPIQLAEYYHALWLDYEGAISFKSKSDSQLMELHSKIQKGEFNGVS
jgi:hypothetical protein